MEKSNITRKQYQDGKQRIVLIHAEGEKVVINNAYDKNLNAQVKVNKNFDEGTRSKRFYKR